MNTATGTVLLCCLVAPNVANAQQQFEVTVAVANVRSEPNTSGRIVAQVPRGTVLDVQGTEENWVSVTIFDVSGTRQQGFIRSDLGRLETLEPAVAPQPEPTPTANRPPERVRGPDPRPAPAPPAKAESSPLTQTTSPTIFEQRQWSDDMDRVNQRARRAKWLTAIGGGAFGLGLAIRAKERETGYQYVTDYGFGTAGALYIIGAGLAGYGVYDFVRARGQRRALEAEGRQKGFFASISPTGAALGYRLTF